MKPQEKKKKQIHNRISLRTFTLLTCGLIVDASPQIHIFIEYLKSYCPKVMALEGQAFGSPHEWAQCPCKRHLRALPCRGPSLDTDSASPFIFDFASSRIVRNKRLLCVSFRVPGFPVTAAWVCRHLLLGKFSWSPLVRFSLSLPTCFFSPPFAYLTCFSIDRVPCSQILLTRNFLLINLAGHDHTRPRALLSAPFHLHLP